MFSIKRSAATLGVVVAGLLAAAGPASAQIGPASIGVKAPASAAGPGSISGEEMTKAIVPAQLSIGTAEVFELNTLRGTQVGSEGGDGFLDIGTTETLDMNAMNGMADDDTLEWLSPDAGSGDDHLRGEAIDIIP